MYISRVGVTNIRSIKSLVLEFSTPAAGWHVIIGDNGSGKTSLIRAIAIPLIGDPRSSLLPPIHTWLSNHAHDGQIEIDLTYDMEAPDVKDNKELVTVNYKRASTSNTTIYVSSDINPGVPKHHGFSAGFGPFRRLAGGNSDIEQIFNNASPQFQTHRSLFSEAIALTEPLEWIKDLDYQRLKEKEDHHPNGESQVTYESLMKFINETDLLPNGTKIHKVDQNGILFKHSSGAVIDALELSDGYRSILSLTFELIRQMVQYYGYLKVFENVRHGIMNIPPSGVVLIDEIDAHLHPTWQTRIGYWFTQYFPNVQFIVTTHSPLICRACEKNGKIWRLATPASDTPFAEITGDDRQKLIYGNILDAYGTEVFGQSPVRSAQSDRYLKRLGKLNMLSAFGKISEEEEEERQALMKIFQTDATIST